LFLGIEDSSQLAGMEVSALKYSGGIGLHGRSPLLRLQSDERLVALIRRGNTAAFEVLVGRYEVRLLAFCRHMLGSREDAEDVLQEALAAAYNAMLADTRPINVRPWLYRIARNRSLNHMRRTQAVGVDSMDIHLSNFGASTADKVNDRETFRMLVGDINELPETQRTALVLREMDALSYEQIAEAMETTVPSVKSLLVRARVSLAEAAEARLLTCDEVRIELGELAEGLRKKMSPPVRRHLKSCSRCSTFQSQLKQTNKALAALLPIGPLVVLRKLLLVHLGHSATTGAAGSTLGAGGAGATGASAGAGAVASAGAVTSASSLVSAGVGALATKAAVGLAAAALVTAGAVEVGHHAHPALSPTQIAARQAAAASSVETGVAAASGQPTIAAVVKAPRPLPHSNLLALAKPSRKHAPKPHKTPHKTPPKLTALVPAKTTDTSTTTTTLTTNTSTTPTTDTTPTTNTTDTTDTTTIETTTLAAVTPAPTPTTPGRTATTVDPTVLPPADAGAPAGVTQTDAGLTPTTSTTTTAPAVLTTTSPAATTPTTTLTDTTTTPTTTITGTTTTPIATTTTATTPTPTTPTTTTPTTTTPTTTTPTTTTPTTTTPTTTTPTTTTPTTTTPTTTTPTTTTPTTTTPAPPASTTPSSGSPTP
jgi:RNA polymerase sigma factor (sigma-70 family)